MDSPQINMLTVIPLEIQYLILDRLSTRDVVTAAGALKLDIGDLYWTRRHKFAFALVMNEISAIDYSVKKVACVDKKYNSCESVLKIGEYKIRHLNIEHTPAGQRLYESMRNLMIYSNKPIYTPEDKLFPAGYTSYNWNVENNFKGCHYVHIICKSYFHSKRSIYDGSKEDECTHIIISDMYARYDNVRPRPLE